MQTKTIFWQLLKTRLLIAAPTFFDKIINLSIWAICSLYITGYIMQGFGLSSSFGVFQLAGVIVTAGLFEIYPSTVNMLLDFSSEQTLSYYVTLPTTPQIVINSIISGFALQNIALSLWMIPLGKCIFYDQLSLPDIAWIKLLITVITAGCFFATLPPTLFSIIKSMQKMGNAWSRFIFPLWFLGGFQFSWHTLYGISKPAAYFVLCNPVTYIMEASRASILSQENFLNWYLCIAIICCFTFFTWTLSYYRMKRLLDFVE